MNVDPDPQWIPLGRGHVANPVDGLPFDDDWFDGAVAHHVLQAIPKHELPRWLAEIRRVVRGPLRVSVPDLGGAVEAWTAGDTGWFPLTAVDVDDAFCTYLTQGGATRSVFTRRQIGRLLTEHYGRLCPVEYQVTWLPGLETLDSRPGESIYLEAR